ncbi:uncharacterized protein VTP21DRAFT_10438 [Calcarisporiella thermophila]|uniref:uncharacterized protein n=1 Tax=Calcarisporiella thermophila TaxID=911321 RepID=UPI003742E56D
MSTTTLFRSEEMSLIQLYIPTEVAHATVAELGELGLVQFRDLNPDVNAFQRAFVSEIRRFDELERKCRFFSSQLEKVDIPIRPLTTSAYLSRARHAQEIDDLEATLTDHETKILQMNSSYETLQRRYLELTELRHVLKETAVFFEEAESRQEDIRNSFDESTAPLLEHDLEAQRNESSISIGYVSGVISRARLQTFERVLWRALRGNLYMNYAEIDEPITDPATDELIRKLSESLGATLYTIDASAEKRREQLAEVTARIEDINNVLSNTNQTRRAELLKVAENISAWSTIVKKEKATYSAMNLFNYDSNRKCLIAEGWCPTMDINRIQLSLRQSTEAAGGMIPSILNELRTTKEPPTFHRTNKFTAGFQNIVDAYGVAKYREVNPGLFTIISFPFLFAVMFGDLGHGAILTLIALWMVLREKRLEKETNDEIFGMFFFGRYIILLMGLFSIFTGLIYNDIFSLSMSLFKSGWEWPENFEIGQMLQAKQVGVYPFGIDPMKQAIIFGVIQMTFGIILTNFNYIHFNRRSSVWAEFVPQILFMMSIFGYLVFTIILKWSIDWYATDADGNPLHNSPPSLLNMLIFMFLSPGSVDPKDQLFPGQGPLQGFLLLLAIVCVPWMLLAHPLLLRREHKRVLEQGYRQIGDVRVSSEEQNSGGAHFDFSDVMINQGIHTIEFCLECISNTASYLRLWALSLAHALPIELSAVLWNMTLKQVFNFKGTLGVVGLFIGFAVWFSLTIFILLLMEGLSAFLHALRLHWVEFNGKFYKASGVKFEPFSFANILDDKAA